MAKKGKKRKRSKTKRKEEEEKDGPVLEPGPGFEGPEWPDEKREGKKKKEKKKGKKEKGEDLPEDDGGIPADEGPPERPVWKRIGIAVGVAIGINAAILPAILIPIMGIVIVLMLAPYAAALVGGRWLRKDRKVEWLGATIYVELIWPTILTLVLIAVIGSLGPFDLELEVFGGMIIGMIYIFPLIFTTIGFFQGSEPPLPSDKEV